MEAIKCPNCGSEKCQEVTKEKWICLACDNVFLIHNLSKEFKKTDEHLTEVHQDLSKKLNEITDVSKAETNKCLYEAEEALKSGDWNNAYLQFKKYAAMMPDSYVGYEGMYRSLVNDYKDALGDICVLEDGTKFDDFAAPLHLGFDVLKKALNCADVEKQELLSKVSTYYKSNTKQLLFRYLFAMPEDESEDESYNFIDENSDVAIDESLNMLKYWMWLFIGDIYKPDKENLNHSIEEAVRKCEKTQREHEKAIVQNRQKIKEYEQLSKEELRGIRIKAFLPAAVIFVIAIVLFNTIGIFGLIIGVIAFIVACLWGIGGLGAPENREEGYQDNIDNLKVIKGELHKATETLKYIEGIGPEEMERLICDEWDKGMSADDTYRKAVKFQEEREQERMAEEKRQQEIQEGYFQVQVVKWGYNPKAVRDKLESVCLEPKYVKECYKQRSTCTITGFRKSVAYELQTKLMECGATVYVQKM